MIHSLLLCIYSITRAQLLNYLYKMGRSFVIVKIERR